MNKFEINGIKVIQCKNYPNYAVSEEGKVFRISSKKEMADNARGCDENTYPTVRVCHGNIPDKVSIHLLVATAWVQNPNPDLYIFVNHKDGNKRNPRAENLEWVTASQNQRHALSTGLKGRGETLYNSSLKEDQVHEICNHLVDGWLVKDIANKFSVSRDIVAKIRAGDTYFHIRQLYEIPHTYRFDFSEATVRWICDRISEGFGDKQIVKTSNNQNLTIIDVKRIRYKIRYKYVSDEYF